MCTYKKVYVWRWAVEKMLRFSTLGMSSGNKLDLLVLRGVENIKYPVFFKISRKKN